MHFEYFIRICCFHPAFFCIFYETSQNSHEKYMYVTWLVKCDMNWENKQNNVGWLKSCNIAHCPTFTFVSLSLYFFFLLTPRLQITDWTDLRNSCPSFPCPVLHFQGLLVFAVECTGIVLWYPLAPPHVCVLDWLALEQESPMDHWAAQIMKRKSETWVSSIMLLLEVCMQLSVTDLNQCYWTFFAGLFCN